VSAHHELGTSGGIGFALGVMSLAVPDGVESAALKVVMAALIASASAIAHFYTMRLLKRGDPKEKSPPPPQ
jgi:hypothetical protein